MSKLFFFFAVILFGCTSCDTKNTFYATGAADNDLLLLLQQEGCRVKSYDNKAELLQNVPEDALVLLLSGKEYPDQTTELSREDLSLIEKKKLRVYAEFVRLPDVTDEEKPYALNLERVVVADSSFCKTLSYMELLSINGSYIMPLKADNPYLVVAKVAGFDKAEYGLTNTQVTPLLFRYNPQVLIATAPLSRFASTRFSPEKSWQGVWTSILSQLTDKSEAVAFNSWLSYVAPAYAEKTALPEDARKKSVENGIQWFYNGHFLVDASWKNEWIDKYQGDGSMPIGPELPADIKDGDGSLGVLEGHCSFIYHDGKQKYRYWMRNDVQGESSMAFALASKLSGNKEYLQVARNLNDYSFRVFRDGPRNDPNSPTFGLLGWSVTHPWVYYGDDNARSILGLLTSASILEDTGWNREIMEMILANYRTTGKNGFRGERLEDNDIQKNGLAYYSNRDLINPHPHFESWMWACYLWLYQKTGYEPLYECAQKGIRITMEQYPDGWRWTNGIQQERARMILPLAWLVRVNASDEHRQWLNTMIDELLKNQQACGAIREELGDPKSGLFGRTRSNDEYGKHEAPLIFNNNDPIADMLYTNNFAFIGLNEAAKATGDPKHLDAVNRMSDFLTRIQVKSDKFKNIDGAWFRAFNYHNWDYWASNADAGWGAWSTLTGWIQSWIISTQVLLELETSLWDIANQLPIDNEWDHVKTEMLREK